MITTIDCDYLAPRVASAHLVEIGGEAAFVETNTNHAVPRLLGALERAGLAPEQVRWVIVTHIHLDHAGGAGRLMEALPEATLLAHPRAAPHAIDPSRIAAGAAEVYGAERFAELYGTLVPVPEARVRALDHGASVELGGTSLTFLHSRGHANHHFCVVDPTHRTVFTGDSFGIVYPDLQTRGRFAFPSTSPTDFDGEAALASLDAILSQGMEWVHLTHFGGFDDPLHIAEQLRPMLERSARLVEAADTGGLEGDALDAHMQREVRSMFAVALERAGLTESAAAPLLELDVDLNAQGLAFAVRKARFKRQKRP